MHVHMLADPEARRYRYCFMRTRAAAQGPDPRAGAFEFEFEFATIAIRILIERENSLNVIKRRKIKRANRDRRSVAGARQAGAERSLSAAAMTSVSWSEEGYVQRKSGCVFASCS